MIPSTTVLQAILQAQLALRAEGQSCGENRVARLMREHRLSAKARKHRTRTTDSPHKQPVAPNLLNRECTASAPNTKRVADITAIWTLEGWLYLAVVLDIFSQVVVGWLWTGIGMKRWWSRPLV
jgi:putative transposase